MEIPRGRGGRSKDQFLKGKYGTNMEFLEVVGGSRWKPFLRRVMDIFWNNTIKIKFMYE